MEKIYDEHPAAALIKAMYAGGVRLTKDVEEILPGVSRIRPGYLADNQLPAPVSADDLSSISDEMLDEIIRDGRDHLPPCPDSQDYEDMHITLAAKRERAKRLLSARAGKPFTAETPGKVTF